MTLCSGKFLIDPPKLLKYYPNDNIPFGQFLVRFIKIKDKEAHYAFGIC